MARMRFGGTPADVYLYEDTDGDLHAGGGFNALFYTSNDVSGQPITDLLDASGTPVTYITTSDGSTAPAGPAAGQLPVFWGPDGVYSMWMSVNSSPRQLVAATNVGEYFDQTKEDVDNLLNSGNPNPLGMSFTALNGIDSDSLDGASVGSTLIKQLDGNYGAGGAPIPLSDIFWVAAVDAPDSFDPAQYICDGVADDVQIQAAINNAFGMRVALSPGTFNLAAPVVMAGPDNAALVTSRYLTGSGVTATKLVVGSGVVTGIQFTNGVSAHLSDFTIQVAGGSRGIYSTHTSTPAAQYRAWFNGSIRRVTIQGPSDGTHTTFALSLKSILQCTIQDVHVNGTGFGMEFVSEDGSFIGGFTLVERCSVTTTGANSQAYRTGNDAGVLRAITFLNCSAITDPVYTNTTAWRLATSGGETAGVKLINCSARGHNYALWADSGVYELDADFSYIEAKQSGQGVNMAGWASRVVMRDLYVQSTITTYQPITDTNADTTMPNVYELHVYAPSSGTTLTGSAGTGFIARAIYEGSPVVPYQLKAGVPNTAPRGVLARANRITNKVFTGGAETAVMRLDGIQLRAGRVYSIRYPRLRADFTTGTDRAAFRARVATGGAAATVSSTVVARVETGDVQTVSMESLRFPATDEVISILLTALQYTGTSTATVMGVDEGGIDLIVEDLGLTVANGGVNL